MKGHIKSPTMMVATCMLAAGLAMTTASPASAQPDSSTTNCAALFRFAQEPVPVVKTADGQTTLATVQWGYNATHNICYLILDDHAVTVLRANAASISGAAPPQDEAAAARCHIAYNPQRGFARQPVPVVKTADGQTTLATVQWGYNATYDICYLVLDDTATTILRTAAEPRPQPEPEPEVRQGALSTGGYHTCWLTASGAIECSGNNSYGQTDAPAGQFTAVSAGARHSCALRTDSTIECWGHNISGQASAPWGAVPGRLRRRRALLRRALQPRSRVLGRQLGRSIQLSHSTIPGHSRRRMAHLRIARRRHHCVLGPEPVGRIVAITRQIHSRDSRRYALMRPAHRPNHPMLGGQLLPPVARPRRPVHRHHRRRMAHLRPPNQQRHHLLGQQPRRASPTPPTASTPPSPQAHGTPAPSKPTTPRPAGATPTNNPHPQTTCRDPPAPLMATRPQTRPPVPSNARTWTKTVDKLKPTPLPTHTPQYPSAIYTHAEYR